MPCCSTPRPSARGACAPSSPRAAGRIVPVIAPDADGGYDWARLVVERTVTVNTAAAGGNAALLSLSEDLRA